ncbi:MAG: hypothetical protein ABI346_02805 [Candidatus Baltobacteraceae bacterium]
MAATGVNASARRAFLAELIDDAGLFPPAALSMRDALAANARSRASAHAWMLGRFIVPVARLAELLSELPDANEAFRLSAIVEGSQAAEQFGAALALQASCAGRIAIEAFEVRIPTLDEGDLHRTIDAIVAELDASGVPPGTPAYLECGFPGDWRGYVETAHDALAGARARSVHDIGAKVRCGGVTAESVPSVVQVAETIGSLRARGVPFKATAGLHHPLRHHNAGAGFTMHGFLNVIGAAVLDHADALDARERHRVVVEHAARSFRLDDAEFGWDGLAVDAEHVAAARRDFVRSYGSCSFTEPVDELIALGMLEPVLA